jgi:tetratricopeptide (TPR) repeat protein
MAVLEGERFQTIKDLGSGAMGRVSLVQDNATGELVALKRLHEVIAAQGGARLRREFRALERIQHENVIKVLGYGDEDGIPFLVMEYVRGKDLADYLLEKPPIEKLLRVFVDIAAALGAVHAQGIVHRDLKPENIRVTPEGSAKLMDFGLAKSLEGTVALTRAGAVVGTVLYMAPEQCRGALLDYRADLYALGAVMYWAFCGRAPFIGEGLAQVVMQHLQAPPTPPRVFNPDIPEALERLILALLSKNPGERPGSANAVIESLSTALLEPTTASVSADGQARADALLLAPLIGREAELNTLLPLIQEPDPVCGIYAVTGDVGVGKTRLIRALADEARARDGTRFVVGEAIPDDPTPFGAISRLILSLARTHRNLLDSLSDATRGELARIAPSALDDAPPTDANVPPEVARLRLFEAATELLERASQVTVLVLENLHWADDSTLALLAHATRAATSPRLIVSYRLEDLPEGQSAPKGLSRPRVTVAVSPLGDAQMRELLNAWLDGDIDDALEGELVAQAGGNPWVLEERLKAMLESGAVYRKNGVYEWNHAVMTLPDSLNDLLSHRIGSLPVAALEFARAAGVLGKVWAYDDVRSLLEWDDDTALDALETLIRARLVQELPGASGNQFRFTHPLYTEVLLDGLMNLKRRRLHGKAAQLLEGKAEPLELAYHHYFASNFAQCLKRSLEAGLAAQMAFAYPQAERAYRLGLDASAKLEAGLIEAQRCKFHLAEVLSHTGRNEDAIELWQDVLTQAPGIQGGEDIAAQTRLRLVKVQRFLGALAQSRSLLGELDADDPFFGDLSIELSLFNRDQRDWVQARHYGLEALSASRRSGHVSGQVRALTALSSIAGGMGNTIRAEHLAELAVNIAETTEDAFLKTEAWNELGRRRLDNDLTAAALEAWKRATEYARTTGDLRNRAGLEINIAANLMVEREYDDARERLREARKLAARAGLLPFEQVALYNLGTCEYALSHLEVAREHFQDVRSGNFADDARVWEVRITLELGDGFVYQLPETDASEHRRLLEAQWALSFGDYQKAWRLTHADNPDYPYAWTLCRVHALWRSNRDPSPALETLRTLVSHEQHLEIEQTTAQRHFAFVKRALGDAWTADTRPELSRLANGLRASSVGLLARDVLLALGTKA